jgi:hypothetical protein
MTNQLSGCRRAGRWAAVASAGLVLGLAVHAQDTSPPFPSYNFEQATAYPVVGITAECGVVMRVESEDRVIVMAGVSVPPDERNRARLRQFLDSLLMGEAVYLRPEPSTTTPPSESSHSRACLFRAPDGLFANLEVVRQGYVKVQAEPPCEHLDLLRHYEQRARQAQKGVWARSSRDGQSSVASAPESTTAGPSPQAEEITVYVTKTGKKYHRAGCPHLQKSSRAITLKEALEKGYEPCSRCKPPTLENP